MEPKTTIQIVRIEAGGAATHVRKLTVDIDAKEVLAKILEIYAGHLGSRKMKAVGGGDRGQK